MSQARPTDRASMPLMGLVLMVGFTLSAPCIDTFAKLLSNHNIPLLQIVAARFVTQSVLMTLLILALGIRLHIEWRTAPLYMLRGLCILVATMFFIAAVGHMPIADAIAIFFVSPFILTLLGKLVLKEQVGWYRIGACIVGFGGALLVIQPRYAAIGLYALLPLGTALSFALYLLLTRAMSQNIHPLALQAVTSFSTLIPLIPLILAMHYLGYDSLSTTNWDYYTLWLIAGIGISATVAHLLLAFAASYTHVASLAPLQYLEMVSAVLLGYFVFRDLPDPSMILGVSIIICSGIYMFIRQYRHRAAA